jgi:hypothetical protein
MTNDELSNVLFRDIMHDASLDDIAPLTTALMQSLDNDQVLRVQLYIKAAIAARLEETEGEFDDEPEFPARLDAVVAGVRAYRPTLRH